MSVIRPLSPLPLTSFIGSTELAGGTCAPTATHGQAHGRGRWVVGREQRPPLQVQVQVQVGAGGAVAGAAAAATGAATAAADRCGSNAGALPSKIASKSPMLTSVTHLDLELLQHTGAAGRDFHGGFVGLDRDQGLLQTDGVTHIDHDFNDRYVFEVTNIRHDKLRFGRWQLAQPLLPKQEQLVQVQRRMQPLLALKRVQQPVRLRRLLPPASGPRSLL